MIEVKNITKRYGDHTAVDNLSFTMEKGRIYGFLGPNGAGKSTTMNIMTGYIAASQGTVTIDGVDIVKKPEKAKMHIGYLPEIPPLYQDMTVKEYLTFVAELKRVPKADRRDQIARVTKMTMLGDYQDRLIRNLSKGYKQRVGLAQALIGDPEVIILDEPTVGLDPQQIMEIRDLIRSLKADHIVMLSSHILSEVNEVCDEVMILSHGRLVASGTPAELEAGMQKTMTLSLSVLGTETAVRSALSGTAHITGITCGEPGEDGALAVTIETDSGEDIRPDIARALAASAIPVMSMNAETQSLEEVFLELTSQEAIAISQDAGSDDSKEDTQAPDNTDIDTEDHPSEDTPADEAGEEAEQ
ncbi:MAG: ABC transporter ATP-binding protein [Lachnospiraceae bacterium]|nr:ABC transporter ATP-binding protein [Lachnospiraceae bacterium]